MKKVRKGELGVKQKCTDDPYGCSEGLQCLRFCTVGDKECDLYCVKGLDGECQADEECFSEFCNEGKCTERKKNGESCSKPNECAFFKCEDSKCIYPEEIQKPAAGE